MNLIKKQATCLRTAGVTGLAVALLGLLVMAPAAAQAAPPFFEQFCETGGAAGQCHLPGGVAVDPTSGDVYVTDSGNSRVQEFSIWGQFIRAFGGGAVVGGGEGTGNLTSGSNQVSSFSWDSGTLREGEGITGPGITPGTIISSVGVGTLRLSQPAEGTITGSTLSVAEGAGHGSQNEVQRAALSGSPTGGTFTLTFVAGTTFVNATAGSNIANNTRRTSGFFHVGDEIGELFGTAVKHGFYPPGTDLTQIGADGSLTLSADSTDAREEGEIADLETTAPLPFNATAAEVREALEALPAIGPAAVGVTGPAGGPFRIEFKGHLADLNVPQLNGSGKALSPLGAAVALQTEIEGAGGFGICNSASECRVGLGEEQAGTPGVGSGEFRSPSAVSLDSEGNVYVGDEGNHRIQKFDSSGHFILTFGAGVDRTNVQLREEEEANSEPVTVTPQEENVCTATSGDACGSGTEGSGSGQFEVATIVAIGPNDEVYVGSPDRIQRFATNGTYEATISVPGFAHSFNGKGLAVAPGGEIYATLQEEVVKLSASGTKLESLQVAEPKALATDQVGNVYVVDSHEHNLNGTIIPLKVREFNAQGVEVPGFTFSEPGLESGDGIGLESAGGITTTSACGLSEPDLLVSNGTYRSAAVRAYGPPPDPTVCPPPSVPPTISAQFATSTEAAGATLRAQINPHFWPDATFYVEYGTGKCSEGGCTTQVPVGTAAKLTSKVTNETVETPTINLTGLAAGTEYHYRFVAQSGGGGPVRGVGSDGLESTFRTSTAIASQTNCPNQAFRTGPSAKLPDCRAYEMVSPIDKNGGNVGAKPENHQIGTVPEENHFVMMDQGSADGSRVTYTSFRPFAEAQSAPYFSQYLSTRGSEGWSTKGISPPRSAAMRGGGVSFLNRFQSFSEDLCSTTFFDDSSLPLVPEAPAGYSNLYRLGICSSAPTYELLTDAVPFGLEPEAEINGNLFSAEGASADLSHTVFAGQAAGPGNGSLTPDSCKTGNPRQLYESSPGGLLRLVSLLPNGKAACKFSAVGAGGTFQIPSTAPISANAHNAVSPDGSRIFWSATQGGLFEDLYLRINSTQPQSKVAAGKCTEPERACTIAISEGPEAVFWGANPETTKALYTVGQLSSGGAELREYDVEEGKSHQLAQSVSGVVGESEDLSRVYFTSRQVLSGNANGEGDKALQGQLNLYLEEAGSIAFVATIGGGGGYNNPDSLNPGTRTSRVTADGLTVAFTAATQPTHYDNTDAGSGEPDTEVFLYTADPGAAGRLVCVSCNPGGDRPSGAKTSSENGGTKWAAAELPPWTEIRRPSRLLSADGNRLFFESYSNLVPGDTNGRRDVYEWDRANSSQRCEEAGAGMFSASNGGCLSLISTGQSADESELIDASADGSNVFFSTSSSLLPQDPGLVDVYDARVDGGFPQPIKTAACEGEACQGPLTPPNDPTPGSATLNGAGNVKEVKAKKAHKKKHAKKHSKKKKQKKQNAKRRANDKRRAGR